MIIEGRSFENSTDLRLITDSISNLIAYVDSGHRYRFANRALEDWFGLPNDRIVGTRVRDLLGEEDYEFVRPFLNQALRGERVSNERTIRSSDGREIHVHTTYSPDADSYGSTPGVIVVATDITDLKRADESLSQAYRRAVGLNRVGQAIRQRRAPEDVQRIALEVLAETLSVDRCLSMVVDRPRNSVEFIGDWHRPGLPDLKGKYSLSQFGVKIEEIFPANNTLVVEDVHNDRFSATTIGVLDSMYISSFVDVPLSEDEEVVGILGVNMAEGTRIWTREEVAFVESVASQLRSATEARRLLSQAQARAERQELINRISAAIRTDMDPDGIQSIAAKMLGEALHADRCLYITYEWNQSRITVEEDWRREGLSSLAGVYPATDLRRSMNLLFPDGSTAIFRDVGVDMPGELTNIATRLEVRALLGVPLYHAGRLAAAVFVGMSEDRREWTPDEVDIVQQVATLTRTAGGAAAAPAVSGRAGSERVLSIGPARRERRRRFLRCFPVGIRLVCLDRRRPERKGACRRRPGCHCPKYAALRAAQRCRSRLRRDGVEQDHCGQYAASRFCHTVRGLLRPCHAYFLLR